MRFFGFDGWGLFNPVKLLKKLFKNPLTIFIYGVISKWYITIVVGSLIVTYWTFKGLEKAGLFEYVDKTLGRAIEDSKIIAQHCIPQIADRKAFISCFQNLSRYKYEPSEHDQDLNELIDKRNQFTDVKMKVNKKNEINAAPESDEEFEIIKE